MSGCRVYPTLNASTGWQEQTQLWEVCPVEALLHLVTELQEEVNRLRSIWESKREIDYWSHPLPSQKQIQQVKGTYSMEDSLISLHLTECIELKDKGQWQQVHVWHSRHLPSGTFPPSHVPVCNRYEALQADLNNIEEHSTSGLEVSPKSFWLVPCFETAPTKKRRWVAFVGDSLPKGTKGPIWRLDPLRREVCYLPGTQNKNIKRKHVKISSVSENSQITLHSFVLKKWTIQPQVG